MCVLCFFPAWLTISVDNKRPLYELAVWYAHQAVFFEHMLSTLKMPEALVAEGKQILQGGPKEHLSSRIR